MEFYNNGNFNHTQEERDQLEEINRNIDENGYYLFSINFIFYLFKFPKL